MKLILKLLFVSGLLLGFTVTDDCPLNYDGIYTASVDAETDAHIKFYADGLVIVSTSIKNTKDVATWFNKSNIAMILSGKYKKKGCKISFSVKGDTGAQKFSGTIVGNTLEVSVKDAKTRQSTERVYKLVVI